MSVVDSVVSVRLDDERDELVLLDQTLLPNETKYLYLKTPEEIFEAIYYLRVRGAPAIGISAAYGLYLTTKHYDTENVEEFAKEFKRIKDYRAVKVATVFEDLVEVAMEQNFVPVVDDRDNFIGIVTRRSILREYMKSLGIEV